MISVDSNVILSALNTRDANCGQARRALANTLPATVHVISPPVHAELNASADIVQIQGWLNANRIGVLWPMPEWVWTRAGQAFFAYAKSRRGGALPRRILADFLIAAHAEHHGADILTFDSTIYAAVFPDLNVIVPT